MSLPWRTLGRRP